MMIEQKQLQADDDITLMYILLYHQASFGFFQSFIGLTLHNSVLY